MAASSASASSAFTRGLVVVAALGSVDDLPLLASNMLHFPRASWDCVALSYRRLPPAGRCEYIHREGWLWGSLLNLTTAHVTAGYSHVFVLLDDLALPKASFNLSELLWVQQRSGLVAVSPTVAGASRGSMSPTQVWTVELNVRQKGKDKEIVAGRGGGWGVGDLGEGWW